VFKKVPELPKIATQMVLLVPWWLQLTRVEHKHLRFPIIAGKCYLHDITAVLAISTDLPLSVQADDRFARPPIDLLKHRPTNLVDAISRVDVPRLHIIWQLLKRESPGNLHIPRDVRETALQHWTVTHLVREDALNATNAT
jgi:hypothetical protein